MIRKSKIIVVILIILVSASNIQSASAIEPVWGLELNDANVVVEINNRPLDLPDSENITGFIIAEELTFVAYINRTVLIVEDDIWFDNSSIYPSDNHLILFIGGVAKIFNEGIFHELPVASKDIFKLDSKIIDGELVVVWLEIENNESTWPPYNGFHYVRGNTNNVTYQLFNRTLWVHDISLNSTGISLLIIENGYNNFSHLNLNTMHWNSVHLFNYSDWQHQTYPSIHRVNDSTIIVDMGRSFYISGEEVVIETQNYSKIARSQWRYREPWGYYQCGNLGFMQTSYDRYNSLEDTISKAMLWDVWHIDEDNSIYISFFNNYYDPGHIKWLDPLSCTMLWIDSNGDTMIGWFEEKDASPIRLNNHTWQQNNLVEEDFIQLFSGEDISFECELDLSLDTYAYQSFAEVSLNISEGLQIQNLTTSSQGGEIRLEWNITLSLDSEINITDIEREMNVLLNASEIQVDLRFADLFFTEAYSNHTFVPGCKVNIDYFEMIQLDFDKMIAEQDLPQVLDVNNKSFLCLDNKCLLFISQGTFVLNGDYNLTSFTMLNGQETNISDSLSCLAITNQQTQIEINGTNAIISKKCIVEEPTKVEEVTENNTNDNSTLENNSEGNNSVDNNQQPTNVTNSTANQSNIDESPNTEQPIENNASQYQQFANIIGAVVLIILITITLKISFRSSKIEQGFDKENELIKP